MHAIMALLIVGSTPDSDQPLQINSAPACQNLSHKGNQQESLFGAFAIKLFEMRLQ